MEQEYSGRVSIPTQNEMLIYFYLLFTLNDRPDSAKYDCVCTFWHIYAEYNFMAGKT